MKVIHSLPDYDIVQCKRCTLAFAHPRPTREALDLLYSNSYFGGPEERNSLHGYASPYDLVANAGRDVLQNILRRMAHFKTPGRLLEIGCAHGYFLSQAADLGWNVMGIEYNHASAALARQRFGLSVLAGEFLDTPLEREHFDAIVMLDLIEHLPEPIEAIKKAWSLLNDDGLLVLRTPDIESKNARSRGARWPQLKPPEHLFFFSEKSLSVMFQAIGFSPVFWQNLGGIGIASRVVGNRRILEAIKCNRWLRNCSFALGTLLNRGDCILAIARKPRSNGGSA